MTLHDVSRSQIGLRAPTSRSTFDLSKVVALVIHYTTGEELGQPDAGAWWRNIQAFHMGRDRGWADIGYGYGIHARQDQILAGRGLGVCAAHSPGWNCRSVSLAVMGDDDPGQDVLEPARRRIVKFRDELFDVLGREVSVLGHRQTQPAGYTPCPGDELQGWINAGMPVDNYPAKPDRVRRAVAVTAAREPDQTSARYLSRRHLFAYVEPVDGGWHEPALGEQVDVDYLVAVGYRAADLVFEHGDGKVVAGPTREQTEAAVAGLLFGPDAARRRPWA